MGIVGRLRFSPLVINDQSDIYERKINKKLVALWCKTNHYCGSMVRSGIYWLMDNQIEATAKQFNGLAAIFKITRWRTSSSWSIFSGKHSTGPISWTGTGSCRLLKLDWKGRAQMNLMINWPSEHWNTSVSFPVAFVSCVRELNNWPRARRSGSKRDRQTRMGATEAEPSQTGKETAEEKTTSSEIIGIDHSLQTDVDVAMIRGEKTSDSFLLFIFLDQHSKAWPQTDQPTHVEARPDLKERVQLAATNYRSSVSDH